MRRAEANPILSWIPLFTLVSLLAFMFSEGMIQHSLLEFDLGPVPTQTVTPHVFLNTYPLDETREKLCAIGC